MRVDESDLLEVVNHAAGSAQRKGATTVGAFVSSLGLSLIILTVGFLIFILGRNRRRDI